MQKCQSAAAVPKKIELKRGENVDLALKQMARLN